MVPAEPVSWYFRPDAGQKVQERKGLQFNLGVNAMRQMLARVILLALGVFSASLAARAAGPILDAADEAFLRNQAQRMVASAAMAPGQCVSKLCNETSYAIHVPGGNMGYTAFWVRDSIMMLGGDLIPAAEVEGWIRLVCGILRGPEDWHARPGVVIPAYAVPDHINFDGQASFYPGNYKTGTDQGGDPFGKYPPLDDDFYFVTAVYDHWKMTQSTRLFNSLVKIPFAQMKLSEVAEKVYDVPLADPATGLVMAGDVKTENARDWGFCDGEFKSGKLLFPSVLKYIAARQLAELFSASGQAAKAERFRDDAARFKREIPRIFFHATANPGEGWLHSATEVGNQPDVWGSAFAIWSGAVDGPTAQRVGRALVRAYREKTAVKRGCVRQLLTTDTTNHGYWERAICGQGENQNGGYWGTPTGWYIAAIHKVDPKAAADMAKEYIQFLKGNMRPDGLAQALEWFSDNGKEANPLYVATVALPYLSLKVAGLLGYQVVAHAKN